MNTSTTPSRSKGRRKTTLLAAVLLACGLASGNAGAQWIVHDPTTLLKQLQEYAEEAARWQAKLQQYQSTLTNLGNITQSAQLNMPLTLNKRPESFGIDQRCPSPNGGGIAGFNPMALIESFMPDLNGDVLTQQQVVCANIVVLENKKYNELVDLVTIAEQRQKDINAMLNSAKSSNTEGNRAAADLQAQQLMAKSLTELQYSQARVSAYDGMIQSLTQDMQALAKKGLQGGQNPLQGLVGTIVQGATLEVALQAARARDR